MNIAGFPLSEARFDAPLFLLVHGCRETQTHPFATANGTDAQVLTPKTHGTDGKRACRLASHRDLGFSGDSRDCFPEALRFRKLRLGSGEPAYLFTDKVFVIHAGETPLSGLGVCFHPLNGFLGVFAGTIHPTSRWSYGSNSDAALKIRTIATGKKIFSRSSFPQLGTKQKLRRLAEHLSSLNQRAG